MLNKTFDACEKSEALIGAIIQKMSGLNKARKKFMLTIFMMYLGLRGRYNFLNMARYGEYSEQTYRNQFSHPFDFIEFNTLLIKTYCSSHLINVFDPSFIPKSGKTTDHLGMFWSGCSQKALRGLEIGGFAVVDVENNTAFSLEAIQTPASKELKTEGKTLVNHYASLVIDRKDVLLSFSKYIGVDGYFAKKEFIHPITAQTELQIISKMRQDANLYHIYKGDSTGKKGRPKTLDGKINMSNPDKRRVRLCYQDDNIKIYEAIVYSISLKRKVKLAYLELWKNDKYTGNYAVLFSTDLDLSGLQIYQYYKSRYQIEFLFRDAKQYTGLTHCQARSENKLTFHFNASLTAVSIAKAAYYLKNKVALNEPFSMSDIKTVHLNKIIADRIFNNLDIDLSCRKNRKVYLQALWLGKIAS
jgi:hypothetical protein